MDIEDKPVSGVRFCGQCLGLAGARAWKAFAEARGWVALVAALCTCGFIAGWIASWGWDVNRYFIIAPVGVAVFVFVWNLLKSPFLLYKELGQKQQDELGKQEDI